MVERVLIYVERGSIPRSTDLIMEEPIKRLTMFFSFGEEEDEGESDFTEQE